MNYIVFDMEWNQPSYSRGRKTVRGVGLNGEIIQIGAVRLDDKLDVSDSFIINIEPVFYKKLNSAVARITGITSGDLAGCLHFPEAYRRFLEFCGDEFCFITWGCDDIPMLRDNILAHGMSAASMPRSYDLQRIFNCQVTHGSRQWSLESAMETLEIEQRHPSHNALYDAVNTAKIALRLDIKAGIGGYDNMLRLSGLGGKREIAEGFADMESALNDEKMRRFICPLCERKLSGGEWIGRRGKRVALAECPEHGMLKFAVTASHVKTGFCATRRVTPASEEMIASYSQRLAAVK